MQPGEVTYNIRQHISLRVTDFIQHLFSNDGRCDQTTGVCGLGDGEGTVGLALDNRIADMRPVRHLFPVCEQPTGPLCAAFDDVPGERSCAELVILVRAPVKLVDERAECQRRIHHAPGNHHIGSCGKCRRNRKGAEIGIRGRNLVFGGKGIALVKLGHTVCDELIYPAKQIVTFNNGNLKGQTCLCSNRLHALDTGLRVQPPGIGDQLRARLFQEMHILLPDPVDQIDCIAKRGVLFLHLAQR